MYNFQKGSHGPAQDAEREKAAYDKLLAQYQALQAAADEGVYLVTIQCSSGAITVPVPYEVGRSITVDLVESQSKWLTQVEKYLNYSLEAVGDELRVDRKEQKQEGGQDA